MGRTTLHLPELLHQRLEKQFGRSAMPGLFQAFQTDRDPTFRVNTLKLTEEKMMEILRMEKVRFERLKSVPGGFRVFGINEKQLLALPCFQNGEAYLQGEASMMPVLALDPQPGEMILDLCAAPGSKTTQIASKMKNTGRIVAAEQNEIRFQTLVHNLEKQGADIVEPVCTDATLLFKEYPEAFDRVLADVPCTAEGRIDLRKPRTWKFWSQKNIVMHAKLQRRLLRSAVRCLKPGGTLVYSTCTLSPEENEQMVAWTESEFPELRLVREPARLLPSKTQEGFFLATFRKAP